MCFGSGDPITLIPCGHTVCRKCVVPPPAPLGTKMRPSCPECKALIDAQLPNKILSELEGKFVYSGQVLTQLRTDLNAAAASALVSPRRTSGTTGSAASAAASVVSPRTKTGTGAATAVGGFPAPSNVAPYL